MNVRDLINLRIKGFKEALIYGITEAEALGKQFIGITLSNQDGIILHLNPFSEEVYGIYYFTKNEIQKEMIGIFDFGGNTYKIYKIDLDFLNGLDSIVVESVEVIKGVLEDFLSEAMAK
ncbi:MAG: hypothetical protein QXV69_03015 [Sulfolobaceae archaeon]